MTIEEGEKVFDALWIIKHECVEHRLKKGRCNGCWLFNRSWGNVCSLRENWPYNWDLPPIQEADK